MVNDYRWFKSKYKHVKGYKRPASDAVKWMYQIFHLVNGKERRGVKRCIKTASCKAAYETEREAAKAADMALIRLGREPVNILKRK